MSDFALGVLVERSIVSYEIFEAIAEELFILLSSLIRCSCNYFSVVSYGNDVDIFAIFSACMYSVFS